MRQYCPTFATTTSNCLLRSKGCLRPTPSCRTYNVVIVYEAGGRPATFVEGLRSHEEGERIPHTYAPNQPCLYYPGGREWRSEMVIATTIIPWLALWLYYYEVWLATGSWEGGGIQHEPTLKQDDVPNP